MSDLDKFKEQYSKLATFELRKLATNYNDMRKDALPVLFEELEKRDQNAFVEEIRTKIELEKELENQKKVQGTNHSLESSDEISSNPEILDDSVPKAEHGYTRKDLINKAYKKVLAKKANLITWSDVRTLVLEHWDFSEQEFAHLGKKLRSKKKNANAFLAFALILAAVCIFLMVASDGQVVAFPGILIIIIGFSSYSTDRHLGRILKSKDELRNAEQEATKTRDEL